VLSWVEDEGSGVELLRSLERTEWTLVELAGAAIDLAGNEAAPYLVLEPEEGRVSGSGGCNRLVGSFELEAGTLRFSQVATTRMACAERVMQHEAAFLAALAATSRFELGEETLVLLDGDDPVALLTASS
jgi:heat shock protein HslJ